MVHTVLERFPQCCGIIINRCSPQREQGPLADTQEWFGPCSRCGLTKLIAVLEHRGNSSNPTGIIGFPTIESGAFTEWRTQSLVCLESLLGSAHVYVENFKEQIKKGYRETVEAGIGILRATKHDLVEGDLNSAPEQSPILLIEQICLRFHLVARQLRSRHGGRPTLDTQDEYDVQDLMHSLLHIHFEDVRAEEYTPSYAGKSSRMDFLLKREAIVIELKMTRAGLGPKELSTQLIEDIERYKTHPSCQALVCFVYDPTGLIPNPRGIESDLKRDDSPFPVRVLIRPI